MRFFEGEVENPQGKRYRQWVETDLRTKLLKHDTNTMNNGSNCANSARTKTKKATSKFGIEHWRSAIFHPFTIRDGKKLISPNWMAALCHEGHRESLGLQTDNKEAAADIAKESFIYLKANGWAMWRAKYKPQPVKAPVKTSVASVAEYLDKAQALIVCDPKTFEQYGQCLRRVAADIKGIGCKGDLKLWREQVGAVTLDVLTPEAVNNWQIDRLKKAGSSPVKKLQTGTSINSTIRMAKALFIKNVRSKIKVILPAFVPFADCERQKHSATTFKPKFEVSELANAAVAELKETELEMYKAFVFGLLFGLRRNEVDKLEWSSFIPDKGKYGILRIETTEFLSAKTEKSCADLPISDPSLKQLLLEWKAKKTGTFIIESDGHVQMDALHYHLRCRSTFRKLNAWLKAHGVTGTKPFHSLRKSYGSILNDQYGIHAAKVGLRHSNIGTTCAYYTSEAPVGLPNAGLLLNGAPTNIVEMDQSVA